MERVAYSRCIMVPTASSLAVQLGLLSSIAAEGVDVELGDYEHKGDRLWIRHAGLTKHIWARARGAETRLLALSPHVGSHPIFVRKDSGIANPADLAGKRMAMIRTTNQEFDVDRSVFLKPYYAALRVAGLRMEDVQLVETALERELVQNVPPKGRNFFQQVAELFVVQLARGEVDAIATPLPPPIQDFFQLQCIYDTRDDPDLALRIEPRALVVSRALVDERRELVVRLMAQMIVAGGWTVQHPDAALGKLAADLQTREELLRGRGIEPVALTRLDLDAELLAVAEAKKAFLLDVQMIERDFDLAAWADASLLHEAQALAAVSESPPS